MTARIIPLAEAGRSMILSCYPVVRSCLDKATVVCRGCLGSVSSLCSAPSSKIEKPVVPLSVKPRLQTWHKVAFAVAGLGAAAYLMKSYGFFTPHGTAGAPEFASCSGMEGQDAVNCILKNTVKWDVKESSVLFASDRKENFEKLVAQMFPSNDCAAVHAAVAQWDGRNSSSITQTALRILQSMCPNAQFAQSHTEASPSLQVEASSPSSIEIRPNEPNQESSQQVAGWASPGRLLSFLPLDRCSSVVLPTAADLEEAKVCEVVKARRQAFFQQCLDPTRREVVASVFQPLLGDPAFEWLKEQGWSRFDLGWQQSGRQGYVYETCKALLDDCQSTQDVDTKAFIESYCPVSEQDAKQKLALESTSTAISLFSNQLLSIETQEVVFLYNFYQVIITSLQRYSHYKYNTKEHKERLQQIEDQLKELRGPYENIFAQHADVQQQYGTGFVMENLDNIFVEKFLQNQMDSWEQRAKENLADAFNEPEFSQIVGSGVAGLRLPPPRDISSASRQIVCSLVNLLLSANVYQGKDPHVSRNGFGRYEIDQTPVFRFFQRANDAIQQHLVQEKIMQLENPDPRFLEGLVGRIEGNAPLALGNGDGSVSDED